MTRLTFADLIASKNESGEIIVFKSYQWFWNPESNGDPDYDDVEYFLTLNEAMEHNNNINPLLGWTCIIDKLVFFLDDILEYMEDNDIAIDEDVDFDEVLTDNIDSEIWIGKLGKGDEISGDVIVEWSWEKHVGYCRNLHKLWNADELGYQYQHQLITGNEERTYRHNYSVLVKTSELEGLSDDEKMDVIMEAIQKDEWKWNSFNRRHINESLLEDLNLQREEAE